jgi:hypothetical protein
MAADLGYIEVVGTRLKPREVRRAARKEKRLRKQEFRQYKKIADAEDKLQTIEQKREGYSHGGRVKPN